MTRNEIISRLEPYWGDFQNLMRKALHSDVALLNGVNDGILGHKGKMLRPMVCLLTASALGEVREDVVRLAAASELLHNATLMHDDVADESNERRGEPTLVSLLGPTAAVLIGDFWLSRAVELVFDCNCRDKVERLFSQTMSDLSEGEMLQLQKAGTSDTDEEDYFTIIYNKTASLFVSSCVSAAISVGASAEMQEAARQYARCLGLAFQIKDDILDYAGTADLGKPLGIDIKEQKITLPLLGALKNSDREQEIRRMVGDIHEHPENCEVVRRFVIDNGGVEYASRVLEDYIRKAEDALSEFPDGWAKDALIFVARFNTYRNV